METNGERLAGCVLSPRLSHNGDSVVVWAGIASMGAFMELIFIDGSSLIKQRYIEEVLT